MRFVLNQTTVRQAIRFLPASHSCNRKRHTRCAQQNEKDAMKSFSVNFRLILFVFFCSIGFEFVRHFNACNGNQWHQGDNDIATVCSMAVEAELKIRNFRETL